MKHRGRIVRRQLGRAALALALLFGWGACGAEPDDLPPSAALPTSPGRAQGVLDAVEALTAPSRSPARMELASEVHVSRADFARAPLDALREAAAPPRLLALRPLDDETIYREAAWIEEPGSPLLAALAASPSLHAWASIQERSIGRSFKGATIYRASVELHGERAPSAGVILWLDDPGAEEAEHLWIDSVVLDSMNLPPAPPDPAPDAPEGYPHGVTKWTCWTSQSDVSVKIPNYDSVDYQFSYASTMSCTCKHDCTSSCQTAPLTKCEAKPSTWAWGESTCRYAASKPMIQIDSDVRPSDKFEYGTACMSSFACGVLVEKVSGTSCASALTIDVGLAPSLSYSQNGKGTFDLKGAKVDAGTEFSAQLKGQVQFHFGGKSTAVDFNPTIAQTRQCPPCATSCENTQRLNIIDDKDPSSTHVEFKLYDHCDPGSAHQVVVDNKCACACKAGYTFDGLYEGEVGKDENGKIIKGNIYACKQGAPVRKHRRKGPVFKNSNNQDRQCYEPCPCKPSSGVGPEPPEPPGTCDPDLKTCCNDPKTYDAATDRCECPMDKVENPLTGECEDGCPGGQVSATTQNGPECVDPSCVGPGDPCDKCPFGETLKGSGGFAQCAPADTDPDDGCDEAGPAACDPNLYGFCPTNVVIDGMGDCGCACWAGTTQGNKICFAMLIC